MGVADIAVLLASAAAIAGLGWFFFGPRKARTRRWAAGCSGWRSPCAAATARM